LDNNKKEKDLVPATPPPKGPQQKISDKLSEIIYLKSIGFPGFAKKMVIEPWEMSSFSESKALSIAKSSPKEFIAFNQNNFSRIYPAGTRFASSNYDPYYPWGMGCQLVALNYQTIGSPMWMNEAMFSRQERCGYILKSPFLRGLAPRAQNKYNNLTVRVLSARQLPKKRADDLPISPYVQLTVLGHSHDEAAAQTQVIKNNGYCPSWCEQFPFQLASSSTAFLGIFIIDDEDKRRIGHYSIMVESIRPGYRIVPLYNDQYRLIPGCDLLCYFSLEKKIEVKEDENGEVEEGKGDQ